MLTNGAHQTKKYYDQAVEQAYFQDSLQTFDAPSLNLQDNLDLTGDITAHPTVRGNNTFITDAEKKLHEQEMQLEEQIKILEDQERKRKEDEARE